ncbi:hypothetical protein [Halococcus dombrowskii]|uniref:hypothetical protein n=1 Tax=Halococcus dombrowskii TaxID=179637 RepID=UPI0031E41CD7
MEWFEDRLAEAIPIRWRVSVCEIIKRGLFVRRSDLLHRAEVRIAVRRLRPVAQPIETTTWRRRSNIRQIEVGLAFEEYLIWIRCIGRSVGIERGEATIAGDPDRPHDLVVGDACIVDLAGVEPWLARRDEVVISGYLTDRTGSGLDLAAVGERQPTPPDVVDGLLSGRSREAKSDEDVGCTGETAREFTVVELTRVLVEKHTDDWFEVELSLTRVGVLIGETVWWNVEVRDNSRDMVVDVAQFFSLLNETVYRGRKV